jgi:hypothetical protein
VLVHVSMLEQAAATIDAIKNASFPWLAA